MSTTTFTYGSTNGNQTTVTIPAGFQSLQIHLFGAGGGGGGGSLNPQIDGDVISGGGGGGGAGIIYNIGIPGLKPESEVTITYSASSGGLGGFSPGGETTSPGQPGVSGGPSEIYSVVQDGVNYLHKLYQWIPLIAEGGGGGAGGDAVPNPPENTCYGGGGGIPNSISVGSGTGQLGSNGGSGGTGDKNYDPNAYGGIGGTVPQLGNPGSYLVKPPGSDFLTYFIPGGGGGGVGNNGGNINGATIPSSVAGTGVNFSYRFIGGGGASYGAGGNAPSGNGTYGAGGAGGGIFGNDGGNGGDGGMVVIASLPSKDPLSDPSSDPPSQHHNIPSCIKTV